MKSNFRSLRILTTAHWRPLKPVSYMGKSSSLRTPKKSGLSTPAQCKAINIQLPPENLQLPHLVLDLNNLSEGRILRQDRV